MKKLENYKCGYVYVIIQKKFEDDVIKIVSRNDLKELVENAEITINTPVYIAKKLQTSFDAKDFIDEVAERECIDYEFLTLTEQDEKKLQELLDCVSVIINKNKNWYEAGEELDISELFFKEGGFDEI